MQTDHLLQQVQFIKEIDKLKYIQRKTKLFNSERNENDAEHSWHLAMMTIVLAQHSDQPIDVLKVLKMVLIHDIVEIDAGDTFIYDSVKNHTNTDEELIAAKRIFGLLPKEQADDFIAIWQEFEDGITNEAKFAKAMDRFEPLLQNTSNNGGTWSEFDVPYQKVYDKKKVIKEGSATIWKYAENLINESVEKGILLKQTTMKNKHEDIIRKAYSAFNKRNIADALSTMQTDVQWSKAWEGGHISGHQEIKEYWTRQWTEINPNVEPFSLQERANERLEVQVHQIVKDLQDNLMFDGMVKHVYTFENGLIKTMDIELIEND